MNVRIEQCKTLRDLAEMMVDQTGRNEFIWGKYVSTGLDKTLKEILSTSEGNIMDYGAGLGLVGIKIAGELNAKHLVMVDRASHQDINLHMLGSKTSLVDYLGVDEGSAPQTEKKFGVIMMNDIINFIEEGEQDSLLDALTEMLELEGVLILTQTDDSERGVTKFKGFIERISSTRPDLLKKMICITHDNNVNERGKWTHEN